jgi:hypothetical protein
MIDIYNGVLFMYKEERNWGWESGSRGRATVCQAEGPEFKPLPPTQKKMNEIILFAGKM